MALLPLSLPTDSGAYKNFYVSLYNYCRLGFYDKFRPKLSFSNCGKNVSLFRKNANKLWNFVFRERNFFAKMCSWELYFYSRRLLMIVKIYSALPCQGLPQSQKKGGGGSRVFSSDILSTSAITHKNSLLLYLKCFPNATLWFPCDWALVI